MHKTSRNDWCLLRLVYEYTQEGGKAQVCTPRQYLYFDVPTPDGLMAKSDSGLTQEKTQKSTEQNFWFRKVFCCSSILVMLSCCLLNALVKLLVGALSNYSLFYGTELQIIFFLAESVLYQVVVNEKHFILVYSMISRRALL